jgi:hypothetical protein
MGHSKPISPEFIFCSVSTIRTLAYLGQGFTPSHSELVRQHCNLLFCWIFHLGFFSNFSFPNPLEKQLRTRTLMLLNSSHPLANASQ